MDGKRQALEFYDHRKVPRRKSDPVIDAFLEKGFALVDAGGGDIVWEAEFFTGTKTSGIADLQLRIKGEGPRGLIEDLDKDVVSIHVDTYPGGGFYFMCRTARLILQTYGDFNVRRRGE